MRTLPPQHLRDADTADMAAQLREIFYEILFIPIAQILAEVTPQKIELENADVHTEALKSALLSGRIQYAGGVFSGVFSAQTSVAMRGLGAVFNKRDKTYRLEPAKVPGWVSAAGAQYTMLAKAANLAVKAKLDEIQKNLVDTVKKNKVNAAGTISRVEEGFKASAKSLEVLPELNQDSKARLAAEYSDNMELWIKNFTEEMISDLREDVEENAMQGYRFDKLIEKIKNRSYVTVNKARFLARQETALFMSNYRKQRFTEAGLTRYRWSTSRDRRVRDSHRHLDGTIQFYSQPPIVDPHTGRRGNPGTDYNCRCVDLPIVGLGLTSQLPPSRETANA